MKVDYKKTAVGVAFMHIIVSFMKVGSVGIFVRIVACAIVTY